MQRKNRWRVRRAGETVSQQTDGKNSRKSSFGIIQMCNRNIQGSPGAFVVPSFSHPAEGAQTVKVKPSGSPSRTRGKTFFGRLVLPTWSRLPWRYLHGLLSRFWGDAGDTSSTGLVQGRVPRFVLIVQTTEIVVFFVSTGS